MTTILELNTGVFPDAETVAQAISVRETAQRVIRVDVCSVAKNDTAQWDAAVAAILEADLIVTL